MFANYRILSVLDGIENPLSVDLIILRLALELDDTYSLII